MATELDDAISEAAEELAKQGGVTTEESTSDTTDDTADEETTKETDNLSEDEVKEAQTLYKLLKDPRQRLNIVAALAQDTGLLKPNVPLNTEKQVEKVEKSIAKLIEEALPEYPGLSTKLGPVIEQIVQNERESRAADMEKLNLTQVENEVTRELASLASETKGESRKVETRMAQLMEEVSPGPNVGVKSYIKTLYTLATAGNSRTKVSTEIADKIRRNANNAPDRLKGAAGTARTSEMPSKKMNINESIQWAIEQASKGRTK